MGIKLSAVFWILILIICISGLACSDEEIENISVPESIVIFVDNSPWKGWTITGWVNPSGIKSESACAFAAVKHEKDNDLLAFKYENGEWKYTWHNSEALPKVDEPIRLSELSDSIGFMSYYVFNNEIMDKRCVWVRDSDGKWRLSHMYNYKPLMFFDTSVSGVLRIYNTGWVDEETDVLVCGTYETDLRRFRFDEFPMTVAEARIKLGNSPSVQVYMPTPKQVGFSAGRKYKVYQGPGEEYGQAGGGKATVSTNDCIQVFGEENGWILIQYDISNERSRIGWISAKTLPQGTRIDELVYIPLLAEVVDTVAITDDPLKSKVSIAEIIKGSRVNWIASMGEWAYVEITDNQLIRGFVPRESLTLEIAEE